MARSFISLIVCLILFSGVNLNSTQAAEDEPVLLTIDGDSIGLDTSIPNRLNSRDDALLLVDKYHRLLPLDARAEIDALHAQILKLIPDFQVAYAAADSAEITHVMSEIDLRLAAIQKIHGREYTRELVEILQQAYLLILPTFGDD